MSFSAQLTHQSCDRNEVFIDNECVQCRQLSTDTLVKIAKVLGIRPEWHVSKEGLCTAIAAKIASLKSAKSLKELAFQKLLESILG